MSEIIINEVITTVDLVVTEIISTQTIIINEITGNVPYGGTTGQVLAKKTNSNYDTEWVDQSGGGSDTQLYKKIANTTTIDDTYHNTICYIAAGGINITIPTGLRIDFAVRFIVGAGVVGSNLVTSSTTINGSSSNYLLNESTAVLFSTFSAGVFTARSTGSGGSTSDDITNESTVAGATVTEALDSLQTEIDSLNGSVAQKTGSAITFEQVAIYNTPTTPSSGTISYNFAGAIAGTEIVAYFNHSSQPTFPSGSFVIGVWNPSQLNIVTFIYQDSSNISVTIYSAAVNNNTTDNRLSFVTIPNNVTSSVTTESDITGFSFTPAINSVYIIESYVMFGNLSTGGTKFGYKMPTGSTYGNNRLSQTTSTVAFTQVGFIGTTDLYSSAVWGAFADAGGTNRKVYSDLGLLQTGSTAGTFRITFGSVTGGQQTTIYKDGTYMKITKIA